MLQAKSVVFSVGAAFSMLFYQSYATAQEPDYFPLGIGNRWVYEDNQLGFVYQRYVETVDTTSFGGHTFFVFKYTFSDYPDTLFDHFRRDEEYQIWRWERTDTNEHLLYKLNARRGDWWTYDDIPDVRGYFDGIRGYTLPFARIDSCLWYQFWGDLGLFLGLDTLGPGLGRISGWTGNWETNLIGAVIGDSSYGTLSGVYEVSGQDIPHSHLVIESWPNPFNSLTTISYGLPGKEVNCGKVEIFDRLGRVVRMLIAQRKGGGKYQAIWDGRDEAGTQLPAGIYLCRMVAGDCVQSIKMAPLR